MISETSSPEFSDPQPKKLPQQPSTLTSKLNKNFYQRTLSAILMLLAFTILLFAGQVYCALLVIFLSFMIFNELNSLKRNEEKEANIPLTGILNWYIYFIVNYYAIGVTIDQQFTYLRVKHQNTFGVLLRYHNIITCTLVITAFIFFVLTLKQRFLKYQFRMLGWITVSSCIVIYPSYFIIRNCFMGMYWFVLPVLLIIVNDIFAYIFGYFLGKRPLIAISPKKTWEGYIGGALSTFVCAFFMAGIFSQIPSVTCKLTQLTLTPFHFQQCVPITNITGHVIVIGLFSSLIGPFGGFFASGLKRAIKIKDFADLIPGHGGVSDRMDCQILMGTFVYFYINTFILNQSSMIGQWISTMEIEQKIQLYSSLKGELF